MHVWFYRKEEEKILNLREISNKCYPQYGVKDRYQIKDVVQLCKWRNLMEIEMIPLGWLFYRLLNSIKLIQQRTHRKKWAAIYFQSIKIEFVWHERGETEKERRKKEKSQTL